MEMKLFQTTCAIMASTLLSLNGAMAQGDGTSAEVLILGAPLDQSTSRALEHVANTHSVDLAISENNLSGLEDIPPDQPVLIIISGNRREEFTDLVVTVLQESEREAKTTILLEADASNLAWVNSLVLGDSVNLVIATPEDDISYLQKLLVPIEQEIGDEILLQYDYSALAAMAADQLIGEDAAGTATGAVAEWSPGLSRAGFESGLVTLPVSISANQQQNLLDVTAQHYGVPSQTNAMFSGAVPYGDVQSFNELITNVAIARDCCSDGSCGWDDRGPQIYSLGNIGQLDAQAFYSAINK